MNRTIFAIISNNANLLPVKNIGQVAREGMPVCWLNSGRSETTVPLIVFMVRNGHHILRLDTHFKKNSKLQSYASVRFIHNYVRPMIHAFRYRRMIEEKKFPVPKPPSHRNTYTDWNYNAELFAFGKRLNEEMDDTLLRQAFIDKSYTVTQQLQQEALGLNVEALNLKDNEYMAAEGLTILQRNLKSILTYEFSRFPEEGICALQDYLTTNSVLSHISKHIGTQDLIHCVEIPPTEVTLAKTFCAIISTIEKSSGENNVKIFIQDFVATYLCDKDVNEIWNVDNPWAMLTDILKAKDETFEARLLRQGAKNTLLSVFIVGLYNTNKKLIGTGVGETVEIAQEMGARDALAIIFGTRSPRPTFKFLTERSNTSHVQESEEIPNLKAQN